ncbi:MAG TPA: hypothetical protein VJZ91_05300 [Blastocatellia bacterium]|nr:hypothetical protein [Blastocatellia bacterium]
MAKKQTQITVRVIAKDGKFLGDDIGGSLITIRDLQTGELLAKGTTKGGSGNTTEIMQTARLWSQPIPTDSASAFTARLDLDEPCLVEVTAYGPLGGLQSAHKVSATQWLIPGKDVTGGDGLLLVMPGLLVQVLEPATHASIAGVPCTVDFAANVMMMCGCPISPGGVWDSKDFEVRAQIILGGKTIDEVKLVYAGQPSQFKGSYTVKRKGYYEAIVYAYQPGSGNSGMARVTFFYEPSS